MKKRYADLELFEDCYDFESHDADCTSSWQVFEAEQDETGVVDGVAVLGRAVGPFFVVNGKSQNNRFYERRLWERVLGEVQQTMSRGQMLGTIGHGQALDDNALLEGKVSHRVSKLWIGEDGKRGMGEVLILNTPTGRILNSMIRAGVQFPVSSRGYGKYSGKMEDGTQVVDSDTYKLETFDFVRVPGIPDAIPQIVENVEEKEEKTDVCPLESPKGGDNVDDFAEKTSVSDQPAPIVETGAKEDKKVRTMEENAVLQRMTEEKIRLEEQLQQALEANSQLQNTIDAQHSAISELQTTVEEYRELGSTEDLSHVMDITDHLLRNRPIEESDVAALSEQLEIYEELGTPEDLDALFDRFEEFVDSYDALGSPDQLHEAIDRSIELLEAYNELGTPGEIDDAFNSVETYIAEQAELGTLEEISAICDLLEEYQMFGTPIELESAFEMMNAVIENTRDKHIETEGVRLAHEFDVDPSVAESMISNMGSIEARTVLSAINENRSVPSRYRIQETHGQDDDHGAMHETLTPTILNRQPTSRATRLFETVNR